MRNDSSLFSKSGSWKSTEQSWLEELEKLGAKPGTTSQIWNHRCNLKAGLMVERGELTQRGFVPTCGICGSPLFRGDMHEVLLTRGDIQKLPEEVKILVFSKENCVLVHHGICHVTAQTSLGQHLCIEDLIKWNGTEKIIAWLDRIGEHFRGGQIDDAKRLVCSVAEEIAG